MELNFTTRSNQHENCILIFFFNTNFIKEHTFYCKLPKSAEFDNKNEIQPNSVKLKIIHDDKTIKSGTEFDY
jgi:hypothetical protein